MLQVFHLDVAKLDQDVRYICKCFKCFQTYVISVLFWYLYIFAMVTHVFSGFLSVLQVFLMYVICISNCFVLMCKCFIGCYTCYNASYLCASVSLSVTHVVIRVRSAGVWAAPARNRRRGPVWAHKTHAQAVCWPEHVKQSTVRASGYEIHY
jgi:hypothetical protein